MLPTPTFITGVDGSGEVDIDIAATDIYADLSGSGEIYLTGSAANVDLELTGSGEINTRYIHADNADIPFDAYESRRLNLINVKSSMLPDVNPVYQRNLNLC